MDILHVVSSMDPKKGGVCQAVRTIILGLSERGIGNEVLSLDNPDLELSKIDAFKIHSLGPGRTSWNIAPRLLDWLNQNIGNYDVVIVHGLWQYHTYATYRSFIKFHKGNVRLFVMPHGMLDPYFQRAKGRKIKAIRNWVFWKFIENKLIHIADGLLFTCETEKLLARENFMPYNPKAELVVGLGVPAPPKYETVMGDDFEERVGVKLNRYWLFLSRIDDKKGVDLLIKAYRQVKMHNSNVPVLVIAGPGMESNYGKEMIELASGDHEILFPGMLAGNSKWGAFYGAELFILPSHQENFGIAVVEALACGKVVLISDQVNIWREIKEESGGLVEEDSLDGVVKLMQNWLALSVQEQIKFGQDAFLAYEKLYTVEQTTENFLNRISEIK